MAVIINDFEISVEPPGETRGANEPPEAPAAPAPPRPQDIERIIRHFEERRERVAAD